LKEPKLNRWRQKVNGAEEWTPAIKGAKVLEGSYNQELRK
jgi:predicted secreted protein